MLSCRGTEQYLQGGAQFPTGGIVRERLGVDSVQLRNRQYSLDGRRYANVPYCTQLRLFSRPGAIPRAYSFYEVTNYDKSLGADSGQCNVCADVCGAGSGSDPDGPSGGAVPAPEAHCNSRPAGMPDRHLRRHCRCAAHAGLPPAADCAGILQTGLFGTAGTAVRLLLRTQRYGGL